MKYIILGIKDYSKDCWHDFWYWIWDGLADWGTHHAIKCYVWRCNEGCYTKEGNLRHYIQQRRLANGAH